MRLFDFFKPRMHKQTECSNSATNEEQHPSEVRDTPHDAKSTPEYAAI